MVMVSLCVYVVDTHWHPCIDLILIFNWSPVFPLTQVESESWDILAEETEGRFENPYMLNISMTS